MGIRHWTPQINTKMRLCEVLTLALVLVLTYAALAKGWRCGEDTHFKHDCTTNRVVGGNPTDGHPWQINLQHCKKRNCNKWNQKHFEHICGGSIIAPNWILTAAHCITTRGQYPINKYRVGAGSKCRDQKNNGNGRFYYPSNIIVHPEWNDTTKLADIALIELSRGIRFDRTKRAICLPRFQHQKERLPIWMTVTGWGDLGNGTYPPVLQKNRIPTVTQTKCERAYYGNGSPKAENTICAGCDAGGEDACNGDSGGPASFQSGNKNVWVQVGIVSYGDGCAQRGIPGVYTHVTRYLTWISDTTKEDFGQSYLGSLDDWDVETYRAYSNCSSYDYY